MIIFWLGFWLTLLLLSVRAMYITGDIGQGVMQTPYIIHDITICMKTSQTVSLADKYNHQFACINRRLSGCLSRMGMTYLMSKHDYVYQLPSNIYCGAILNIEKEVNAFQHKLYIEVIHDHVIYMTVQRFNFRISRSISCAKHGLVVFYNGRGSGLFCGRRVPWTMIVPSSQAYLYLTITGNVTCELSIFYSSFRTNWIKRVIEQVYLQTSEMISTVIGNNSRSIQYFIMTKHHSHIDLHVTSSGPLNGHVIIQDGPGHLSNTILRLENTNTHSDALVQTSAYWAFVRLYAEHNMPSLINIQILFEHSLGKMTSCYKNLIFSDTSTHGQNIFCLKHIQNHLLYLGIFVKQLKFSGPDKFTAQSSAQCQYGGLSVQSPDKLIEFCGDVQQLRIQTRHHSIMISMIWFSGYSHGSFSGELIGSECRTFYMELYPANNVFLQDAKFYVNPSAGCQYIVCPSLQNNRLKTCTIQFGPPIMGTVELEVVSRDTIEPCDERFMNTVTKDAWTYQLHTTSTNNWPFGLKNNTVTRTNNVRLSSSHVDKYKYAFLQVGNVTATLLCDSSTPRKQMSILVKVSVCRISNLEIERQVANNIPALSQECVQIKYEFVALHKPDLNKEKNYHSFIYKGNGHITTGHMVSVDYESCPVVCRNYKYSVLVRTTDDKTILQHTSHVGDTTYTGYFHKGFRVVIILPDADCAEREPCNLALYINSPNQHIGVFNEINSAIIRELGLINIYTRRYKPNILIFSRYES